MALHNEALLHGDKPWHDDLTPLADVFSEHFGEYPAKLTYPIRTRALEQFGSDRDCPGWEPDGDSFLSSALVEALLMSRILSRSAFPNWLARFRPRLSAREPASLFTPASVADRSDGKIAHLDGFNFSRAWCWRSLADALPADLRPLALRTADTHLAAALPHVTGDYMGEHWLATSALLALE